LSRHATFKFRLYVAGDGPNSSQALHNLTAVCRKHLPNHYKIEIVDVLREPRRALADNVLMTPTLVKLSPAPTKRIVGNLSQLQPLLQSLGLETEAA
jgi:circadian clock protein KaiB